MWLDRSKGKPDKTWTTQQLRRAIRAEGAFRWIRRSQAQFAVWILNEYASNGGSDVDGFADDAMAANCRMARLAIDSNSRLDLFYFKPSNGWLTPSMLEPAVRKLRLSTSLAEWRTTRFEARVACLELAVDAIVSPCQLQYRMAAETLKSCSNTARRAIAVALAGAFSELALDVASSTMTSYVERYIQLLRELAALESIDPIVELLRADDLHQDVYLAAILNAADLVHEYPRSTFELLAWSSERARRSEDVRHAAAAVQVSVASGRGRDALDPVILQKVGEELPEIMAWADQIVDDPLFTPRAGHTHSG